MVTALGVSLATSSIFVVLAGCYVGGGGLGRLLFLRGQLVWILLVRSR